MLHYRRFNTAENNQLQKGPDKNPVIPVLATGIHAFKSAA